MDFVWIDGTGHGMTFYKQDDVLAKNSKTEVKSVNKNLIYNSDFRKRNADGSFDGWKPLGRDGAGNEDTSNPPFEYYEQTVEETGKTGLLAKNYTPLPIKYDAAFSQSNKYDDTNMPENYEFVSADKYTVSIEASVVGKPQQPTSYSGNYYPPTVVEVGRNLVVNSDFVDDTKFWEFGDLTDDLQYPEPSLRSVVDNYKSWCGLTYGESNLKQNLHYGLLQNGSYWFGFTARSTFEGGMVSVRFDFLDKEGRVFESRVVGNYEISGDDEWHRFTGEVPTDVQKPAGIDIVFIRGDHEFEIAYDSEELDSENYILYIGNISLAYGDDSSVVNTWKASKEYTRPQYDVSDKRNYIWNADFSSYGSYWEFVKVSEDDLEYINREIAPGRETLFISGTNMDFEQKIWPILNPGQYTLSFWHYAPSDYANGFNLKAFSKSTGEYKDLIALGTNMGPGESSPFRDVFNFTIRDNQVDDDTVFLLVIQSNNVAQMELITGNTEKPVDQWTPAPEDSGVDLPVIDVKTLENLWLEDFIGITVRLFDASGNEYGAYPQQTWFALTEDTLRFTKTVSNDREATGFKLQIGTSWHDDVTFKLTNVKMEVGDVATAWCLSDYEFETGSDIRQANTWHDWGIVPTSRPTMSMPTPKTNYVDIPGSNNKIDLTEALTGNVKYNTREGSFEFIMDPRRNWLETYETIANFLHGQRMDLVLDDDPGYYYSGRFSVNEWKSEQDRSIIVIDYVVDAFKYELAGSIDDWLWDPFNFETGIARDYKNLEINGLLSLDVGGSEMPVVPTFIVSDVSEPITVEWGDSRYSLPSGVSHVPQIIFVNGDNNRLIFRGKGTVSISFKGGKL